MLKNILVFCLLHILSISALADRSMDQLELVTLQLRWFHQFQFAGYYAAKEKGFYAEEVNVCWTNLIFFGPPSVSMNIARIGATA